jgi:transposase
VPLQRERLHSGGSYKRLERERFAWPLSEDADTVAVTMQQLEWLLEGFDLWSNRPHETLHYTALV